MLRSSDGEYAFLTESIEVLSQNAAVYLRVVTRPRSIPACAHNVLRQTGNWQLDGIDVPLMSRSVALDQRDPERQQLIVNLLIPFGTPIPVTLGSSPEGPDLTKWLEMKLEG